MKIVVENEDKVNDIAASLCKGVNVDVFPVAGGKNSRVYRVQNNGRNFALKFFRPHAQGKRERFEAETSALELFAQNGMQTTARLIAKDELNNCILMEWLEGERVSDCGEEELKALAEFVDAVHKIVLIGIPQKIRYATEASLCGSEILRQIALRLSRLADAREENPQLAQFIDKEFCPILNEISNWTREQYKKSKLTFEENISFEQQTLSVVDLGFHNILRKHSRFYFLDFEFFGWDDPVKLVADTLQHPGMMLEEKEKQLLFFKFVKIFDIDKTFLPRLKALYPLFGLKWGMIMLNCFLPGYKSAQGIIDKGKQMKRVKNLVESIHKGYQKFSL